MRTSLLALLLLSSPLLTACGGGGAENDEDLRPVGVRVLVPSFDDTIRRYVMEDATGRLHPTASTSPVTDFRRAILNPAGTRLYVINNGGDLSRSDDDGISVYDVGADASLNEIAGSPFAGTDKWPADLVMHPGGELLYVLNSQSQSETITQFAVDPPTGALTEIGDEVPTGDAGSDIALDGTGSYVYVSNVDSDDVSQYAIQPDGTLVPIASPVGVGEFPIALAAHPTQPYLYCANSNAGTITQLEIGAGGGLAEIGMPIEVRLFGNPPEPLNGLGAIAVHPSGSWVYVTHTNAGPTLVQYAVLPDGTLSEIGTPQPVGSNAVFMRLDPSGRFIYVLGTSDRSLATFTVNADGTAEPMGPESIRLPGAAAPADVLFPTGGEQVRPVATHAYASNTTTAQVDSLLVDAAGALTALGADSAGGAPAGLDATFDGRFVYVVDTANDRVLPFAADAASELSALPAVATGEGPTHCAVTPDARFVLTLNRDAETLTQFAIETDGSLTALEGSAAMTASEPRHLAVHPSGRYAYVVNAGTKNVFGYLADRDGTFRQFGGRPITGNGPSWITVHPHGDYAYVTNQDDDTVALHVVGHLGQLGSSRGESVVATGDGPSSVAIDRSGRFAYVANRDDGTISQYQVGVDGLLTPMGSPLAAGTAPRALLGESSGRFLYAITDGAILRFSIGPSGLLSAAADSAVVEAAGLATVGSWE